MTLILGIEDPSANRVILACDSGAWKGDQSDTLRTPKIWRSHGWVAGLAGGWGQSQRVRQIEMPHADPTMARERLETLLLDWGDKVTEECARTAELARRAEPDRDSTTPALLVAYGEWLWYVSDGEATTVERGYQAIGTPSQYALGGMAALARQCMLCPLAIADETMRATSFVSRALSAPFRWMATDGTAGAWE